MENKVLTIEEIKKLHESQSRMAIIEIMAIEHEHRVGSQEIQIICDELWDEVEECAKGQFHNISIQNYVKAPVYLSKMAFWRRNMTEEESAEWSKCWDIIGNLDFKIKYAVEDYIIKAYKERVEWENQNLKWN